MNTSRSLLSPAGVVTFSFFEVLLPQWKTSRGERLLKLQSHSRGLFLFLARIVELVPFTAWFQVGWKAKFGGRLKCHPSESKQ